MIRSRFLFFDTLKGFKEKQNEIHEESIVFIRENNSIYTHNTFFAGSNPETNTKVVYYTPNTSNQTTPQNMSQYVTWEQLNRQGYITAQNIPQQDGIKHVFLTQQEYNALESYEDDAVYFIIERSDEGWHFGDTFPITFTGEEWLFGGTFPITFKQSWTFGLSFPITLK